MDFYKLLHSKQYVKGTDLGIQYLAIRIVEISHWSDQIFTHDILSFCIYDMIFLGALKENCKHSDIIQQSFSTKWQSLKAWIVSHVILCCTIWCLKIQNKVYVPIRNF